MRAELGKRAQTVCEMATKACLPVPPVGKVDVGEGFARPETFVGVDHAGRAAQSQEQLDGALPRMTDIAPHLWEDIDMAWTAPIIEEFACGMEINMYFPAEGEDDLF